MRAARTGEDSPDLASEVRAALAERDGIGEMRMFGGICFTLHGHMLAAASKRGLLLRLGPEGTEAALREPGTRPMEMRGRPMAGYLYVDPANLTRAALAAWLAEALAFVGELPPKPAKSQAKRRRGSGS